VSLEFGFWSVKVAWPITALAACPVVKSAAQTAAAHSRKTEIRFMRRVEENVPIDNSILNYSKRGPMIPGDR
jgi:hypothetical protein